MTEEKITELQSGFNTAFIDSSYNSNLAYRPQFIYNDNKNGQKVFSSIEDELLRCDSFAISVAFITRGGITPLLQTLQELERRGVTGRILTTDYLSFSDPVALDTIASLSNIELRMYQTERAGSGFHTKGYIFQKNEEYRFIIGSSNLTQDALIRNMEAYRVSGAIKFFKQWLSKNVVFIVWNSEIRHVIQRCNKIFRKKPISADYVDLQMIQKSMMPLKSNIKSIESTMKVLGLTWEQSRMLSVLYSVQCMLRLYRKLWKEGMKHFDWHEWDGILIYEEFAKLQQREFFPEIISQRLRAQCRTKIKAFCVENMFQLKVNGTRFEIDANHAVWQFDLANWGTDLVYIPKKYVQIPHNDMQIEEQESDIIEILQKIFARIVSMEERLKFGVGSADVENVLERLCTRVCG